MRKLGTKRKNKKEKAKNSKEDEQNGVNEDTSAANGSNDNDTNADDEDDEPIQPKRSKKKNNNKRVSFSSKKTESDDDFNKEESTEEGEESEEEENDEVQYEVESIIDQKNIKGARYFLIRWKGYGEESDTWEPEGTLNCPQLLKAFKQKRKEESEKSKKNKKSKKKSANKDKDKETEQDWDSNEEFEVDRIIEVHHRRDGTRQFLVSWKGYPASANSWEPEDNLNCHDLIERFMEKVKKAKEVDRHELREVRTRTSRFTSDVHGSGRRASKRQSGKRISYQEYDE